MDLGDVLNEALNQITSKTVMPTSLSSAEIKQQVTAGLLRQSLFSARTTVKPYLDSMQSALASIVQPTEEARPDRATPENPQGLTTVGLNPATMRTQLRQLLVDVHGYTPTPEEKGTITDLSSDKRLSLVIKTNTELAQGAGAFVQANANPDRVDLWPAQELYRIETRKDPRDWPHRWMIAAQTAGDANAAGALQRTGRMVALKSSGIWDALGEGAGGYLDTLGNPYAPFAFNSGMWTREVNRKDAEAMGLLDAGAKAEPADFDWATLFKAAA